MNIEQQHALINTHYFSKNYAKKWLEDAFPEVFKVRKKLVKEAHKRGFVTGAIIDSSPINHVSVMKDSKYKYILRSATNFKYYPDQDLLQFGNSEATIYYNGIWADVINPIIYDIL
jgi:hypothetical protein